MAITVAAAEENCVLYVIIKLERSLPQMVGFIGSGLSVMMAEVDCVKNCWDVLDLGPSATISVGMEACFVLSNN